MPVPPVRAICIRPFGPLLCAYVQDRRSRLRHSSSSLGRLAVARQCVSRPTSRRTSMCSRQLITCSCRGQCRIATGPPTEKSWPLT